MPKDGRRDLVGDGGRCILKIVTAKEGGGVQFSYVIIWKGYSFDTPHFSENPRRPLGRNKRMVP